VPKLNDADTRGAATSKTGEGFIGPKVPKYTPVGEGFTGPEVPAYRPPGTYTAPDYAMQLLEKAGYSKPVTEGTGRQSFPGLSMQAAEDLTPYGYRVSDEEARKILDTYAPDAKGDPAKIKQERVESKDRAVPMTLDAYQKLSDDQRAAVDFNTALIEAREKDINGGWMIKVPSADSGSAEFRKSVFGDNAPTGGNPENVLRLLERIGYKAPGTKLEDFLSLDMAVTADELKDLKLPKDITFFTEGTDKKAAESAGRYAGLAKGMTDQRNDSEYGKVRSAENLASIQLDVIRKASETLAKARANGSRNAWSPAATAVNWLGTGMQEANTPFGWGLDGDRSALTNSPKDMSKDRNFQLILDVLKNDSSKTKLADSQEFWAKLKATGYDEKDIDQLFEFLDQRTRAMLQGGEKPLEGQNDATIIRELAGLGPANG
jgi:hypothetical protein